MKRITMFMAAIALGLVCMDNAEAQNLRTIESQIMSLESRIKELEAKLAEKNGPAAPPAQVAVAPKPPITAPPATESYVIRDGDSIGGIARKFGLPRQALLDANNMAEGQPIYIGESLKIPVKPDHGKTMVAGTGTVHTVKTGDTLSGISRRYGTTIAAIKKRNGLNSDVIGTGQELIIPGKENAVVEPEGNTATVSAGGKFQYENPLLRTDETYGYYAVEKGDNLYALARDFFTTMKELQRLNKMGNSTIIHPGEEMIVPTSKYNNYHQNMAQN
ncbi:MAG: LysM peptidoglycan-binding domain-containing protein [Verrucomicrobiales bacterium]|nr:LysM peptidoglycan-binding domain-containing protein [Verrucomicrobiales bacterium]